MFHQTTLQCPPTVCRSRYSPDLYHYLFSTSPGPYGLTFNSVSIVPKLTIRSVTCLGKYVNGVLALVAIYKPGQGPFLWVSYHAQPTADFG